MKFKFTVLLALLFTNFSSSQDKESVASITATSQYYIKKAQKSFEKATPYFDSENSDSAALFRRYTQESLKYYEKAGVTSKHSYYNALLGTSLFFENKLDSALIYLKQGLKPYQSNPDILQYGVELRIYTLITQSYMTLGQQDSAIVYGHKLLKLATAQKDSLTVTKYNLIMANVYNEMGKTVEALAYFESGAKLATRIKDYGTTYLCYGGAAMVLNTHNEWHKALPMADSAMSYARITGDNINIAGAYVSLASIYDNLEKYDDALKTYQEALQYYEEIGYKQYSDMTRSAMAFVLAKMGRQKEAFKQINAQANITADVDLEQDSLPIISDSYHNLKGQMLMHQLNAEEKTMKLDVLYQEYLERQAAGLRQRIWFISVSAVLIIVLLLLLYNRQRQKARAEAAARKAEEKENEYLILQKETDLRMIRKYIDGLESERSRISKELHDGICNDLLALELELKNSGKEVEKQATFLKSTRENIRNVSHELMPPAFQYATIDEVLSDYIARYHAPNGASIRYTQDSEADWSSIPQSTAFELYRIVQEALGNCIKHANAKIIDVSLVLQDKYVMLDIRDNGTGFDTSSRSIGVGLRIIRERVESIDGKLYIDTGSNGTAIRVLFDVY